MPDRRKSSITQEQLTELYIRQGLTIGRVAEKLGRDSGTVSRALKKYDIPIRSQSEMMTGPRPYRLKYPLLTKFNLKRWYLSQNWSMGQIAAEVGCNNETVRNALIRFDIKRRPVSVAGEGRDRETLHELYIVRKWSMNKIADYQGVHDETIRQALMRNGIPIRTKSESGKLKVFTVEHIAKLKAAAREVNLGKTGPAHHAWKNARWKDADGYVMMSVNGKAMKEHRYVMEQHLGRPLEPWEEIDHKNLRKDDNRLENLEVLFSEHKRRDWYRRRGLDVPPKP